MDDFESIVPISLDFPDEIFLRDKVEQIQKLFHLCEEYKVLHAIRQSISYQSIKILIFLISKSKQFEVEAFLNVIESNKNSLFKKLVTILKPNLNLKNHYEETYLLQAVRFSNFEIVKFLIEKEVSLNDVNVNGHSAFLQSCNIGHLEITKFLIAIPKIDKQVTNLYGQNALWVACSEGNLEILKLLYENNSELKIDPNLADWNGQTPLLVAAFRGRFPILKYLFETVYNEKYDLNASESVTRYSALHYSCEKGNFEMTQYLISKMVKLDPQNLTGKTPLFLASQRGHLNVVKLLVENGANIDLQDLSGYSPFAISAMNSKFQVSNFLSEKGALK